MGCADSIKSVEPPKLAPPPESLTASCSKPIKLPERVLSQKDTENFWGLDRLHLVVCGEIHKALKNYYSSRDAKIMGEKND
jgi:hypothetical protein